MIKTIHPEPLPPQKPLSRRGSRLLAVAFAAQGLSFLPASAAEPDRNAPAAELASFKVADGFEVSLFASEKDGIVKPIQMRFDARGRLWVIGSTTYPQIKPGEEPNDKVWIVDDSNKDGKADQVTVFADGLMIPTGIEIAPTAGETTKAQRHEEKAKEDSSSASPPSRLRDFVVQPSAIYVGEGPKLWLMTDSDGDGKMDKKEVVFRGFGTGDNHQNLNSFRWSPGGELMFCQGLHAFSRVETPHGIVKLDEAGFWRMRPREMRLDAFYGGQADPQNPWGWAWTDWGQPLLAAGNSGNYFYPLPEMIRGVQGGRRDSIWNGRGRKTSGPEIVGTAHFPDDWQGSLITGGYINNTVLAMRIEDDGAGFKLTDRDPLITSTHTSFRPVDVKFGPDGALYVCDWYNPIIGHYQTSFRHPDRDKAHGRIWRITAKGRPTVQPTAIAGAPIAALLENLRSRERFVRYHTKIELGGRPTEEVVKALREWWPRVAAEQGGHPERSAAESKDPAPSKSPVPSAPDAVVAAESKAPAPSAPRDVVAPGPSTAAQGASAQDDRGRALLEALGVFEWHEAPEPALLREILKSKEAGARAYAAGALARWFERLSADFNAIEALADLANDKDARVRLAAIVAAGNIPRAESLVVALSAADQPRDKFIDLALRSSVKVLAPFSERALAAGKPHWPDLLAGLSGKPAAKPAVKATAPLPAPALTAAVANAKWKGTSEFVAALTAEVKEKGDPKRGAEIFKRPTIACIACHAIGGAGNTLAGPPLDAIGSAHPVDFIISAVLEPQREIKEGFDALEIVTTDGATHTGYFVAGTEAERTLRDLATGKEVRLKPEQIAKKTQRGSLMPAALTDSLSREELRDLIRYLSELGKPR